MPSSETVAPQATYDLTIVRTFAAPRELVFRLWSDPVHRAGWWGPQGHALAENRADFREGGEWATTIVNPDGSRARMHGVFTAIEPSHRLAFTYVFDEAGIDSEVEIALSETADGTLMHFRQGPFPSDAERASHDWGWSSSFVTMAAYVQTLLLEGAPWRRRYDGVAADFAAAAERAASDGTAAGEPLADGEVLEIRRLFDAPRELVWRAWSNPEHIARWWGPETCWLEEVEMDFREGGSWAFWMRNGVGLDHRIGGMYRRIEQPGRLTFTYINAYDGHEMEVDLTFLERGGQTEMRFRQARFLNVAERDGHAEGWTSTFDLLADYLAALLPMGGLAPVGRPRRDGVAEDIAAARANEGRWWGEGPAGPPESAIGAER